MSALRDRNLLLGILALDREFITPAVLAAVLKEWVQAKHKGLGQLLREHGSISENQHALLEEFAGEHLARHGDKSLTMIALLGPARQELESIADADLQAGLAQVSATPIAPPEPEPIIVEEITPEPEPAPVEKKINVPRKEPKKPLPERTTASSVWMLAAGGVCCLVALLGVSALFVGYLLSETPTPEEKKEDPPIAEVKPLPKQEEPRLPVVDPAKPDINDVPKKEVKQATGREPTALLGGAWRIEGDELVGVTDTQSPAFISFGSKQWTDYDLTFDTHIVGGPGGCLVHYRVNNVDNNHGLLIGANGRSAHEVFRTERGERVRSVASYAQKSAFATWYAVRIEARGNRFRCYIDEQKVFEYVDERFPSGEVGLAPSLGNLVRWKNIKVTDPAGKILWEGLPELPHKPAPPSDGFVSLFNGKDLTGWKQTSTDKPNWRVENGVLTGAGTLPSRLFTERADFGNFHLRVQARTNNNKSGGIAFRSAFTSLNVFYYEAKINAATNTNAQTGALMLHLPLPGVGRFLAPVTTPLTRPGEWFTMEILADGARFVVLVNGKTTADVVDQTHVLSAGHIALSQHHQAALEFRTIEIKTGKPNPLLVAKGNPDPPVVGKGNPAPIPVGDGFVPLFNGKDLTGWKPHKNLALANIWRVENGILVGSGDNKGTYRLQTERPQPAAFHLRAEGRINGGNWGALHFCCPDGSLLGYEAPINSSFAPVHKTGSLYGHVPGKRLELAVNRFPPGPGEWFTMEVIAVGSRLTLKVNGKTTADLASPNPPLTAGHLALMQSGTARIEFRRIEIKELKAAPPLVVKNPDPPFVAKGEFVPLFNGKDLTGWKSQTNPAGAWRVEQGVLIGAPPKNVMVRLHTEARFKDFHLRAQVRSGDKNVAGITIRSPGNGFQGYNASIVSLAPGGVRVGILNAQTGQKGFTLKRLVPEEKIPPGQWFTLEVIAQGNRFVVLVDGKKTTDTFDDNLRDAGVVSLHVVGAETLEFRKIEIAELAPGKAPPEVAVAPVVPFPREEGFVPLFNGKDLTGWQKLGLGDKWRVENGILTGDGPTSTLHTTRADFKDFHLRAELRFEGPQNGPTSGVIFRSPQGRDGYETTYSLGKFHGGLTVRNPPIVRMTGAGPANVVSGQWMNLEIIAQGNRLKVKVDGKDTLNFLDDKATFASGQIALRRMIGHKLEVRKIEIKELAAGKAPLEVAVKPIEPFPVEEGFVPLFNGKDLTGWKGNHKTGGDWRVVNGVLTGVGPDLRELYSTRDDFGDFHLRFEARINDDGNGFVVCRYPFGPAELDKVMIAGYAARLTGRPADLSKTGSLFVYSSSLDSGRTYATREALTPPGTWFNFEIIAKENRITLKVNGQETRSYLDPKEEFKGGRLVLGFADNARPAVLEFRKIEIKEFKAIVAPKLPTSVPLQKPVALFNRTDLTGWRPTPEERWKVDELGHLVGQGPSMLFTKRKDFKNFNARIVLAASADVEAFLAFRQTEVDTKLKGLTTRLMGDGAVVSVGFVGLHGSKLEKGQFRGASKPDGLFVLEAEVRDESIRIFSNGRATSGLAFAPGTHPPGAVGLYIVKGTVRIVQFEIAEEAPAVHVAPAAPLVIAGEEFIPLFSGKDLTGWQTNEQLPGKWRVANGVLVGDGEDVGILHTKRADFQDFHLRAEARFDVPVGSRNEVLFRSSAGRTGYATAFIAGKPHGGLSIYGDKFGENLPPATPVQIPNGEWFTLELLAQGKRVQVRINGKVTADFMDEKQAFASGSIALRHGNEGKFEFRKIEIKEAKAAPPAVLGKFVPLFNGKDQTGWQPHPKRPGNWRTENGVLIGAAPAGGSLYSARGDYQDFHLRAEVRINDKGFARVFTRAAFDPMKIPFKVVGYETLINQRPVGGKTGALTAVSSTKTNRTDAKESAAKAGEWLTLEIIAKGNSVTVKVDGAVVSEFVDEKRQFARSGHIALHQDAEAIIEIRKVEINELALTP